MTGQVYVLNKKIMIKPTTNEVRITPEDLKYMNEEMQKEKRIMGFVFALEVMK